MSKDPVQDLLRKLADADASAEAPAEIELRLRREFRSWKRRRAWRRAGVWAPVAAAIIVLVFALANRKPPVAPLKEAPEAQDGVASAEPRREILDALPVNAPTAPRARNRRAPVQRSEPAEIVTEFFPLMYPAPPLGRGRLLRVELSASAMQIVGLPVHEDHLSDAVQADVLVGEEGLPRAIRFVQFEMK